MPVIHFNPKIIKPNIKGKLKNHEINTTIPITNINISNIMAMTIRNDRATAPKIRDIRLPKKTLAYSLKSNPLG